MYHKSPEGSKERGIYFLNFGNSLLNVLFILSFNNEQIKSQDNLKRIKIYYIFRLISGLLRIVGEESTDIIINRMKDIIDDALMRSFLI